MRRLWRRSLQTRVVTSTILLSALVIGLTGWALLREVADGLVDGRRDVAVAEAQAGFRYAQDQLDSAVDTEASPQTEALTDMVGSLTGARGAARTYDLVLQGPLDDDAGLAPVRSSSSVTPASLPQGLVDTVQRRSGTFWQFSDLSLTEVGDRSSADREPVVVVGRQLRAPGTGDAYALYYLFSMEDQQSTLTLLRNALLIGGLVMVALVGGVAFLVSRQVLDPVRMARRIAERFAGGHLEQRMHVRGEDDIARLSTSFNQMATSLQSQIRRLENLSRVQQRFVSDVSHELRTPLTTVQMASEVLFERRDSFDAGTARSAELLKGELDRFAALLSDLLDLSRFDAGAAELQLTSIDLGEVARACVDDPGLQRAGIRVQVRGVDEPAVVQADPRRVDRIVRNLLGNAARYSHSDRLTVAVGQNETSASLSIRDYGVGLSGDENLRIFDRFWRADPARVQGGTGLGLPIAREDAALHGGTLQAFGSPGLGTEFILTIPHEPGSSTVPALVSELEHSGVQSRGVERRPDVSRGLAP